VAQVGHGPAQPYQTSGSWTFFIIAISLKFYLPPCFQVKLYVAVLLQVAIAWAEQAKLVLKKFFL